MHREARLARFAGDCQLVSRLSLPRAPGWKSFFPLVSIDSAGCEESDSAAGGDRKMRLFWLVSSRFMGSTYPDNHFMQFGAHLYLPASRAPLSAARLDSALRAQPVNVSEAAGEPPMGIRSFSSTASGARLVNGQVVVFVEGAGAAVPSVEHEHHCMRR